MAKILVSTDVYASSFASAFTAAGWEVDFCDPAAGALGLRPRGHPGDYDLWLYGRPNLPAAQVLANPLAAYRQHTATIIQVLTAAQQWACPRLIFISSATVYGAQEWPTENSPLAPREPNAASLKMAEEIVTAAACHTIILRPGEIVDLPIDQRVALNSMQSLSAVLLGQQEKFYLAGTDYPTPDGTFVRDLIQLADFKAALRAAAHFLLAFPPEINSAAPHYYHGIFNIGRGIGVSVREMMAAMEQVAQQTLPYTCGPRRPSCCPSLILPSTAAQQVLGWQASASSLTTLAHAALAAQNTVAGP